MSTTIVPKLLQICLTDGTHLLINPNEITEVCKSDVVDSLGNEPFLKVYTKTKVSGYFIIGSMYDLLCILHSQWEINKVFGVKDENPNFIYE